MDFRRTSSAVAVLALLAFSGCKSGNQESRNQEHTATPANASSEAAEALPPPAAPVDPATSGTITGVVHLRGTPPARVPIDMSMDPACSLAGANLSEQYIVSKAHGVANVYVYVKTGAPPSSAPANAPPVRFDQRGCRFVPHVAAVRQGGSVEFINSDPTMHNVHTVAVGGNPSIDVSQGPGGAPQVRKFNTPEHMIRIGCNNHPWMNAFLNVAPNPYFAVTDKNGSFTIKGLPPGTYTIAAVHEKLGEQDVQVEISAHGTAKAELDFAMQ